MINKERWEQVESIYHAVLEQKPEARAAFLEQACGGDAELRSEVDSLLTFDGRAERFIERPAIELEAKAIANEQSSKEMSIKEIGPYRLESIISHGGMGDVFLAIDTRLDRKVAIKLLSPEFTADEERVSRFKREARTTSTLNHPNIVTLYEIGEVHGHHYIVTEYVEGQTLRQRISSAPRGQINLTETLPIAAQVLDALQAAHQAGVIHRDVKPENIVLRPDGLVKVLDFGIAKLTDEDEVSKPDRLTTKTGIILGTASYMSPEQARGQKVDHRTDIFSVGAMLFEMLSGERPFEGETIADVMAAVLVKEPKQLDPLVTNLPPALKRIVERCLEKRAEKRFQTASDLAFSLKELSTPSTTTTAAAVEQLPTSAASIRATASSQVTPSRKRRWLFAAIIVGVIVVGIVILKTTNLGNQTIIRRPPAVAKPAPGATPGTSLVWFDVSGNQLEIVGPTGDYSGLALSPNEDRIAVALTDPATKRRDLWIFPAPSGMGIQLTSDAYDDLNPVWTPDGQWIIYTSERNGVRNIYRKAADGTGTVEPVLETRQTKNVEDLSRDGQLLMFNTGSNQGAEPNLATLSLSDLRSSVYQVSLAREDAGRFSPDGSWVAYRSQETGDSEIFVRGISPTGSAARQKWRVSNGRGGNTQPMWRGDGKMLYYLDHKVLTSVEVTPTGTGLNFGTPAPLFKINIEDNEHRNRFVVTKDGKRFLVIVRAEKNSVFSLSWGYFLRWQPWAK